MKIEKPDTLSCTSQPLDWGGKLYQSFTVGLGFDLQTGKLIPADKAWAAAMQGLAPGDCMDMGLPKKQAEWLLAGKAFAPGNVPVVRLSVDVRVGNVSRRLLISGEKEDETFVSMPLTWAKTWGDPQNNPLGVKSSLRHRPPVTDAVLTFGSPACLGPLGVWPCRMKRMGTYDTEWLQKRWPGVPDDFDWSFFNLAQPCQYLPEGLRGDEVVELTNLHPEHPVLSLHLPGKTLHMHVLRVGTAEWKENAITADTLWLFPNELTGLVLWHALTPCVHEIASDIDEVRLVLEPEEPEEAAPVEPAPAEAAGAAKTVAASAVGVAAVAGVAAAAASDKGKSEDKVTAPTAPRADVELPKTSPAPEEPKVSATASGPTLQDTLAERNAQLDESLDEINEALASMGIPPMTPEQVAETRQHLAKMTEGIEALKKQVEEAPEPDLNALLRQGGVSEEQIRAVNSAMELEQPDPADFSDSASWNAAVDGYLASFSALLQPSEAVLNMSRTVLRLKGPGGDALLTELAGPDADASAETLLVKGGVEPSTASRLMHMLESEDIPEGISGLSAYAKRMEQELGFPPGSVSDTIDRFHAMLQEAGIDTDEAKTSENEQKDSEPEKASAQTNAAPTETAVETSVEAAEKGPETAATSAQGHATPTTRNEVLLLLAAGGSLAGLALAGMDLSGLDLSKQDMTGTGLEGGSLAGSCLDGAKLVGANLSGVDASAASFVDADLSGADLSEAMAPGAVFIRTRFDGGRLSGLVASDADCTEASFLGVDMHGANFSAANFGGVSADGLKASGAHFDGAHLRFCSFRQADFDGSSLCGVDFHEAALDGASFREANLTRATFCGGTSVAQGAFHGATLADSAWTGVAASGCVFTGGKAAGGRFTDCDFTAASWRGADVRGGDFSRCRLEGADMQGVNLFRGSLREAQAGGTDLRGANLYGADLYRLGTGADTQLAGADCTNTVLAARKEI